MGCGCGGGCGNSTLSGGGRMPNTVGRVNLWVPMYAGGVSGLGALGDDGDDTTLADWASGSGGEDQSDYGTGSLETLSIYGGEAPTIYGPQPTPQTIATNAAQGLSPGTTSALTAAIGGATNALLSPGASRPSPTVTLQPFGSSAWWQQNEGWLLPVGAVALVALLAFGGRR